MAALASFALYYVADAWGWQVESAHARVLLDRELGLLWGLTRRGRGVARASPHNME